MYDLYFWRADLGLEFPIMFDQPWIDTSEWSTCSMKTQQLAEVYANYAMSKCCDDRPMNFYPLLDRIVAWMDETYA